MAEGRRSRYYERQGSGLGLILKKYNQVIKRWLFGAPFFNINSVCFSSLIYKLPRLFFCKGRGVSAPLIFLGKVPGIFPVIKVPFGHWPLSSKINQSRLVAGSIARNLDWDNIFGIV